MLLKNKNTVIYGAGGSLGGAVAIALAAAGAKVFLTGRNLATVQQTAVSISAAGGIAEAAILDAMNGQAVNQHLIAVAQKAGSIDIVFNAIGVDAVQGMPLTAMPLADFIRPINIAAQTQFITGTAAARLMMQQGSGVILSLTATPGGVAYPGVGGFGPACSLIEAFCQNLASEVGRYGVRVVNIRSGGSPDSRVFSKAMQQNPDTMKEVLQNMEADTMLKRLPPMQDIANVAVFLSSALAANITGVTIDVTGGTTAGLNYRSEELEKK